MKTTGITCASAHNTIQYNTIPKHRCQLTNYILFIILLMFGIKEKTFAQLRDGTGCGKAVIIPLPAQTCNNREFEIKEKEMWFEFQGSGTEVSLKLSPGAQNPVNELTEVVL